MAAILRRYGATTSFCAPVLKAGSSNFAASADWTPAAGDVKVIKNEANSPSNINTLPTFITGVNTLVWTLSPQEMQAKRIDVYVSKTANIQDDIFKIETFGDLNAQYQWDLNAIDANGYPIVNIGAIAASLTAATNASASFNLMLQGTVNGTSSPTSVPTNLTVSPNSALVNRWAVFKGTNSDVPYQAAAITGYTATGGVLQFATGSLTAGPAINDTFVIV